MAGTSARVAERNSGLPVTAMGSDRGHWAIENRCHYVIDWNVAEDRCRIRSGHGPENITCMRRFAVRVIQFISAGTSSVPQKMHQLRRNTRLVFDYLRMTNNSTRPCLP